MVSVAITNRLIGTSILCVVVGLTSIGSLTAVAGSVPLINLDPATQLSQSDAPGMYFGFTDNNVNGTIGWHFQVLAPIEITALAWYDDGGDGLNHAHMVGISTSDVIPPSSANIVQTTIPAGTGADLVGSWRTVSIPETTLTPGEYSITGWDYTSLPDPLKFAGGGGPLPTDPRMSPDTTPIYGPYSGATTDLLAGGVWLGPMVFVVPAPEPDTAMLAVCALLTFCAFRRYCP
jgi:hypothetical protein